MNELLEMIVCVEILANDLHYESDGIAFYANHLLADRVKEDLDKTLDGLREAYWLGELKVAPPPTDDTYQGAIELARGIRGSYSGGDRNEALVIRLREVADLLLKKIEEIKRGDPLLSGTVAILDGLSTHMQTMYGLLDRTARK